MWLGEIGFPAVTTLRSHDWRIVACWPVLDRAQLSTSVVNRNEFHALLLLHRSLLPEKVETGAVDASFWNDCDELIQECLNIVQEREGSEDLLL